MFRRKRTENDPSDLQHQQEQPKSQLDALESSLTVLDPREMDKVEGGKVSVKTFSEQFNWNSTVGDTIPQ